MLYNILNNNIYLRNIHIHKDTVAAWEQWFACQHFSHDTSHRPDVNCGDKKNKVNDTSHRPDVNYGDKKNKVN